MTDRADALTRVLMLVWSLALTAGACADAAQPALNLKAKVTDVAAGERVVAIPSKGAERAVVCDEASMVIIARTEGLEAHLLLVTLDGEGQPTGEPQRVPLPKPASLGPWPLLPLDIMMHPELPLLYVWQDIQHRRNHPVPHEQAFAELDHLLVYRVLPGKLELKQQTCRGPEYGFQASWGVMGMDWANRRLYAPLLQKPDDGPPDAYELGIGYARLGDDGLVALTDNKPQLVMQTTTGVVYFIAAMGFVPASAERVLVGTRAGVFTWDMKDPRVNISQFGLRDMAHPYLCAITGHPGKPIAYAAAMHDHHLYRIELMDGYVKQLPQQMSGSGNYHSKPILLPSGRTLAVGNASRLHLIELDEHGYFTGSIEAVPARAGHVKAVDYSSRFEKFYVCVEE